MDRHDFAAIRNELRLSQLQLARALRPPVHRDTVGGWERGDIPITPHRAMWLRAELQRLQCRLLEETPA